MVNIVCLVMMIEFNRRLAFKVFFCKGYCIRFVLSLYFLENSEGYVRKVLVYIFVFFLYKFIF